MSERRVVIVDGYNLILRSPALRPSRERSLRQAREKLFNLLSWSYGTGEVHFLVVFDGAEDPGRDERQGRVEVRYARPPDKADDLIRRLVEDQVERTERVTVVTADLEVARHARAMGADVSLSDLFLASALGPSPAEPGEKPTGFSKKELEDWAEIFQRRKPSGGKRVNDEEDDVGD